MKHALYAAALLSAVFCATAQADEKDWLSGEFDYVIPEAAKEALIKSGDKIPRLKVTKNDTGWTLAQGAMTFTTTPMKESFYEESLPNYGARHEFQCSESETVVFCHVKPKTKLRDGMFTSNTGYFMLRPGFSPAELTKVEADKK